ncbi:LOB domain-containing protein 2-like [Cornus florida]|uniref:LOB domain-containing protein 2-like n=1 Tax=Cornus florida TaxID=4283 RepID=UPI0028A0BD29|nr:LOB domain-containing protein 2-like [Cornus florida]
MHRNNGASACASCKHQRKKCSDECVLAPHFPAEKNQDFQAVHKVFGVSNVTKIIRSLNNEGDRKRAIDSVVWEALCWQRDPVLGPYGEYMRVCHELMFYKTTQNQIQGPTQTNMLYKSVPNLVRWNSSNNGTCNTNNNNALNYSSMVDSSNNYPLHAMHATDKVLRQERDVGSVVVVPQQHPIISGFNQQYYVPGQCGSVDAKSVESTLWEGGS